MARFAILVSNMLRFLPAPLRGLISICLLIVNTLLCGSMVLLFSIGKLLPLAAISSSCNRLALSWAERWITQNGWWMALAGRTRWKVSGLLGLRTQGWYLVTANHQSWVDIFVLQKVFNRRIPFLKFFLKRELIWVPVIGLCWWALDFPFMRRYSEAFLKKHPHKRGEDLITTKQACLKFKQNPTSVMNFLEGTRYTPHKHRRQQSPYRHLLRPKAGGMALALAVMGEQFDALLDVTLYYPQGRPTMWALLSGGLTEVVVHIEQEPIPAAVLAGDYVADADFRKDFQSWVAQRWQRKDERLAGWQP